MKTILTLAGSVLLAGTLAACSPGINQGIGHRITFDSSGMVVHALGKPNAHVGSDGSLTIDGKAIDVTPAQRELLRHYVAESRTMMQSGEAVGKAGVSVAEHAVGNAISQIFDKNAAASQKALDAQTDAIEKSASLLCTNLQQLVATQKQIAVEIPAFKPYDAVGNVHCTSTKTIRYDAGTQPSAPGSTTGQPVVAH